MNYMKCFFLSSDAPADGCTPHKQLPYDCFWPTLSDDQSD